MEFTATHRQRLVDAFCGMEENDFTRNILVPLLRRLGYERVQFHGGPNERGKDVIAFKLDAFGSLEASVFVVKRLSKSAAANDSKNFHTSVNQMQQAAESEIPTYTGSSGKPSEVVFVTPHEISVKLLESRFNKVTELRPNRCKYLDGGKIAELCNEHWPGLSQSLLGSEHSLSAILQTLCNNEAVLKCIGLDTIVPVDCFHVELDCSLGGRRLSELIATNYAADNERVLIPIEDAGKDVDFLNQYSAPPLESDARSETTAKATCGIDYWKDQANTETNNISKISESLAIELKDSNQAASRARERLANVDTALINLRPGIGIVSSYVVPIPERDNDLQNMGQAELKKEKVRLEVALDLHGNLRENIREAKEGDMQDELPQRLSQFATSLSKNEEFFGEIPVMLKELVRLRKQLEKAEKQIAILQNSSLEETTIDAIAVSPINLLQEIDTLQTEIREEYKRFGNKTSSNMSDVKPFDRVGASAVKLDELVSVGERYGLLSIRNRTEVETSEQNLQTLLEQGRSILLLGDAGSGKSTSLQAFCKRIAMARYESKFVIYAPLGRLVKLSDGDICDRKSLVSSLITYLRRLDVHISKADLENAITTRGTVVVFDAIDEASSSGANLLNAISDLSDRHPSLQVLASSRELRDSCARLALTPVTLKAFSEQQLRRFIDRYCLARNNPPAIDAINEHLNDHPAVLEIIRTPLLATTLCELAFRNQADLPSTEIQLYRDRFRMLSGDLDIAKGIPKRIDSRSEDLLLLCRRIAIVLHSRNSRSLVLSDLVEAIFRDYRDDYPTRESLSRQIQELETPCQLLRPMDEDGGLGFGHLRFQEFFAADEIASWQTSDIAPHLSDPWWRDTFGLYTKINPNSHQFLESLQIRILNNEARETVSRMYHTLPKSKREKIWRNRKGNLTEQIFLDELAGQR
ncbi:NACHT domain-containing protein [Rhodopirellula sp. SWK7]|uniref:NACHT domain-containing protein n=1 Tax=Rhodopirellula sp. SWK7 TaxID=595460 RepID=UPI0002BED448|nr:NACHT domain-containing protein [Rhodopirellula sp. SWK7]EMI44251.1 signal transduction protein [Rhodopirellula sp. SWK7]